MKRVFEFIRAKHSVVFIITKSQGIFVRHVNIRSGRIVYDGKWEDYNGDNQLSYYMRQSELLLKFCLGVNATLLQEMYDVLGQNEVFK